MDVLVFFTIVTIVAILENANKMKANSCETKPNNNDKCILTVTNGKPCYSGNPQTIFASISCDSLFTFDAQTTFTCTGSGQKFSWIPAESTKCSPIGTISLKPTPTMSFTSNSLLSGSSLSSIISSGTPFLETYTTMPRTEINTLSTNFQTDPSAITTFTSSPRLTATSSTIVVASSILVTVTPDPAAAHKVKESDINAAYIAVPVVVCVIALLLGVGIIRWRRRTPKSAALFERSEPGSIITNQVYAANDIDRNCSLMNVRQSRVHEYAEIHLDIMNSGETIGDTYQTIDILPEDKVDVKKSYNTFKISETEFTDTNYSHIGLNNTQNNNHADNTYSHTQLDNVTQKPEITFSGDDTYNKIHSATLPERRFQDTENTDTEYNHAQAGSQYPQNEADNYSHLDTNMRTQGESTVKTKRQCEDGKKKQKSNTCQLSAKDLPSNTGYEFAKDFDNLQSSSEAPEYAKVTKKKPVLNEAQNAGKGYETAVGTIHNYLILEPEQNQAPTAALFNVVEDEPVVKDEPATTGEKHETETDHKYFTLEKLNT